LCGKGCRVEADEVHQPTLNPCQMNDGAAIADVQLVPAMCHQGVERGGLGDFISIGLELGDKRLSPEQTLTWASGWLPACLPACRPDHNR
jgi:hypothetical protein